MPAREQRLRAVAQEVGVGDRDRLAERELLAQAGDELVLAAEVRVGVGHRLELDERPEVAHLVEVDAHVLVEQQVAALLDHDDGAQRGVERLAQGDGVTHLRQPVGARARAVVVGAHVGDQPRAGLAAAVLLAQLQPPASTIEVRVALRQHALVGGAERERALERCGGVGVARLELDVAAGRGHAVGHSR